MEETLIKITTREQLRNLLREHGIDPDILQWNRKNRKNFETLFEEVVHRPGKPSESKIISNPTYGIVRYTDVLITNITCILNNKIFHLVAKSTVDFKGKTIYRNNAKTPGFHGPSEKFDSTVGRGWLDKLHLKVFGKKNLYQVARRAIEEETGMTTWDLPRRCFIFHPKKERVDLNATTYPGLVQIFQLWPVDIRLPVKKWRKEYVDRSNPDSVTTYTWKAKN